MTVASYIAAVLADSPWGFWQLQEAAGSVSVSDGSGGSHGGTYDVPVVTGTGPYAGWSAVNFTGTQGVSIVGVKAQNTPMAFEMWAKMNTSGNQVGMSYTSGGGSVGMEWGVYGVATCGPNAALGVHAPTNAWFCGNHPDFVTSQWQYCVLQLESDNHWRIYITDDTRGSFTIDDIGIHTMNAPTSPTVTIGKDSTNGSRLNALVSMVAWYDHALTLTQITNHFNAAKYGPPPATCAYGTRKKATSPAVDLLTEAIIVGALTAAGLTWWEVLLLVFAGQQIDVNTLCATLPPQPPTPTPDALNYPPYKLLDYLYQNIWNYYCECVPGTPTPPTPPTGTTTKPTGMPDPRVIVVNPTNPCLDLTEVRRMLDTVIRQLNVDVQLDTLLQRYSLPFATVLGAAHSGLTATGSFAISRLIGVQIVITDRGPNRELEGAPNYVWDLGWISCMDGNGFIQERRITRDVEVWMPREFQEATTLGYVFKDGVTARIVELEAEV